MSRWALALAVLMAAAPAHADKKRDVAVALSASGAALSSGLVLASFLTSLDAGNPNAPLFYTGLGTSVITPSLGEIYAGQYVTWGMGIRAGAVALAVVAFALPKDKVACDNGGSLDQTCSTFTGSAVAVLGLAAIGYIGGVALDVHDAGDAADRYNARHGMAIGVAPGILRTPTGQAPGIYFSATY